MINLRVYTQIVRVNIIPLRVYRKDLPQNLRVKMKNCHVYMSIIRTCRANSVVPREIPSSDTNHVNTNSTRHNCIDLNNISNTLNGSNSHNQIRNNDRCTMKSGRLKTQVQTKPSNVTDSDFCIGF